MVVIFKIRKNDDGDVMMETICRNSDTDILIITTIIIKY